MGQEAKAWQAKLAAQADASLRAEELDQRNAELADVNAQLRSKLSSALGMLRSFQQRCQGQGDGPGGADVTAFVQSCQNLAPEAVRPGAHGAAMDAGPREDTQNDVRCR